MAACATAGSDCQEVASWKWLAQADADDAPSRCLVLLNSPVPWDQELTVAIWKRSDFIFVADGAANQAKELMQGVPKDDPLPLPTAVVGDLDSAGRETLAWFRAVGVPVINEPSQDANDLFKCLAHAHRAVGITCRDAVPAEELRAALASPIAGADFGGRMLRAPTAPAAAAAGEPTGLPRGPAAPPSRARVVVAGAMGGRLDHEMQSVNALYCWAPRFGGMALLGSAEMNLLIPAGKVALPLEPWQGPICGVLPIGGPIGSIETTGLRWDLSGAYDVRFGACVSSSNETVADAKQVTFDTSDPVVFSIAIDLARFAAATRS